MPGTMTVCLLVLLCVPMLYRVGPLLLAPKRIQRHRSGRTCCPRDSGRYLSDLPRLGSTMRLAGGAGGSSRKFSSSALRITSKTSAGGLSLLLGIVRLIDSRSPIGHVVISADPQQTLTGGHTLADLASHSLGIARGAAGWFATRWRGLLFLHVTLPRA